jgi:DUF4097 and DUF4098 domain-containing protein YvlB
MKRYISIALMSALVMIVGGFVLSGFSVKKIISPFVDGRSQGYVLEEKSFEIGALNAVNINTFDDNVVIVPTSAKLITVQYYNSKDWEYELGTTGGSTLQVEKNRLRTRFFYSVVSGVKFPEVHIEIPKDLLMAYNIRSSNGKIDVSSLNLNKSQFETSNASVQLKKLSLGSNDLEVTSENGRITLSEISQAAVVKLKTSNARVEVTDLTAAQLSAKSQNGSIRLDKVNVIGNADLTTTNASIQLSAIVAENLTAESENGSIKFDGLDTKKSELYTTNASVAGTVLGSLETYELKLQTSNASIYVDSEKSPDNLYEKRNGASERSLTIRTHSGSININSEK